ncbi:FKBP-type peptidyl-prolyl cis-trans isomerase [Pedobacter insulae]|nr:FKBP-type peptidyl-prolyl cis-trans isomerase [Pedobacter insulae]
MLKKKLILIILLTVGAFSSCKKEEYDPEKQLKIDDAIIQEFITKNSIPAIKHESGIYYQILNPGSGSQVTVANSVSTTYEGRLLNGSIFDGGSADFPLSRVIVGWQIGIPLIKKGGKIRLIVPSVFAYSINPPQGSGIPKNAVLDFTVDLTNVQ